MLFRSVNSTSLSINSASVVANVSGVYTTGTVNAAVHSVGTSFIANTSQVTIAGIPLSANGTTGTSGYVLTSNGSTGAPYWSLVGGTGINLSSSFAFTNTTASGNATSGAITTAGGLGVANNLYVGGRVGFSNSTNISVVYQYYNATTNSLDTVFG